MCDDANLESMPPQRRINIIVNDDAQQTTSLCWYDYELQKLLNLL